MKIVKKYSIFVLVLAGIMLFASCGVERIGGDETTAATSVSSVATTAASSSADDTSASSAATTAASVSKIKGFEVTAPEGWTEDSATKYFWYAPNYPTDPSNINIQSITAGNDFYDMMNYTAEELEALYEADFEAAFGMEIPVTVVICENTKVEGCEAMVMALEYELYGVKIYAKQYVVKADDLGVVFTLTQAGDAEWEAFFDDCVKSVVWTY